jgi:hypothetical protein
MNASRFTRCVRTTLTFLVLWGCRQIQRLVQGSKTLPGIVARELRRPSTHYRARAGCGACAFAQLVDRFPPYSDERVPLTTQTRRLV